MEYRVEIDASVDAVLPNDAEEVVLNPPDNPINSFIEALAHHSAVCRKLHLKGPQPAASGKCREQSG